MQMIGQCLVMMMMITRISFIGKCKKKTSINLKIKSNDFTIPLFHILDGLLMGCAEVKEDLERQTVVKSKLLVKKDYGFTKIIKTYCYSRLDLVKCMKKCSNTAHVGIVCAKCSF